MSEHTKKYMYIYSRIKNLFCFKNGRGTNIVPTSITYKPTNLKYEKVESVLGYIESRNLSDPHVLLEIWT